MRIHIKNKVIDYLEKSLSPEKQEEIEKHLLYCEPCRVFLNKFSSAYFSLNTVECPEINPFFYTRVIAGLNKNIQEEYLLPVSIVKSLKPVAAGLFLLTAITFGLFFGNYISSNQSSNTQVNATNETTYEYYVDNNTDMVHLIINNEK